VSTLGNRWERRGAPGGTGARLGASKAGMMIRVKGLLLLAVALLAGCATKSAGDGGGSPAALDGRVFLSTKVTEGGQEKKLADGTRIRLTFDRSNLGANAGCNHLGGAYRIDGTVLVVNDFAMTDMGCPAPLGEQDQWLVRFLTSHPTFALTGDNLVLTSGQTVMTLVDRRVADPDRPLLGTHWTVTSIIDGEAVSSVPSGADAYFVFEDKDRVVGSTGCNQFRGTAKESTGTITFSAVAMTKMACTDDRGRMESAVTRLFDAGPVTWKIEADVLTLTAVDGHGLELTATK
jgi:heat shock protein HslJ